MVFSEVVGTLSFLQPQCDDDMADRLHYYYTTTFLLVTAVLISLKMFGGRPIECWMPAEYQHSWQEYTEIYCFSMNTYFTPFSDDIPIDPALRERNMISYYQWTPFFLVICAFLFYAPCLIWRILYTKSGIRLKDIVAFATDRSNIQPKMREANMKGMSAHLGSVFRHRFCWRNEKLSLKKRVLRLVNLRFYEAYLTLLYMGIKLLFLFNVISQVFLMNWFLQTDIYNNYGWGVLRDLLHGRPWSDSGNFPRVTYCDMDIRILGNVQKHTIQCVLVINIFIEKVFVLLWAWYSFLTIVTLASLISWILSSFPFEARKQFIARRLELADVEFSRTNSDEDLIDFVRHYIKMDGVFVLRMLTIHAGILVCTEIVDEMWEEFRNGKMLMTKNTYSDTELGEKSKFLSIDDMLKNDVAATSPNCASTADRYSPSIVMSKRKVSVLVPLVAAHHQDYPSHYQTISHSAPTTAARILSPTSPQSLQTKFILRTPNAERWRSDRRLRRVSVAGLKLKKKVTTPSDYISNGSLTGIREFSRKKPAISTLATNAYPIFMTPVNQQLTPSLPENATSESEEYDIDSRHCNQRVCHKVNESPDTIYHNNNNFIENRNTKSNSTKSSR